MQGGDISNSVPPRLIFHFEYLLADLPSKSRAQEAVYCRLKRWKAALSLWELNEHVHKWLWDLGWRQDYRIDVVTFKPEGFAEAVEKMYDEEHVPISRVIATTPVQFSRRLVQMPDVVAVYHADVNRPFMYGSRGKLVGKREFSPY